ncbi:cop9 signalosome complex subunit [Anaeramoeba flamelloides]|uniref:Cop9 signalosome complex subunit n=1 Tax=Anaeramoeba flamelloides TaxID=1746091 RepID=A0AAV7Z3W5_9EUKA|nr:cop9 signalosome complex subunit [Anaeramoeba flamelloides]
MSKENKIEIEKEIEIELEKENEKTIEIEKEGSGEESKGEEEKEQNTEKEKEKGGEEKKKGPTKEQLEKIKKKVQEREAANEPKFIKGVDFSSFDIEDYIEGYRGHTRMDRLLFIAQRSEIHQQKALKMFLEEVKKTRNIQKYRKIVEKYSDVLQDEKSLDQKWIDKTLKDSASTYDSLESNLKTAKENVNQKGIQEGNMQLGHFYFDKGDLKSALKYYSRAKEATNDPIETANCCLDAIKTAMEGKSYSHISAYLNTAQKKSEELELETNGILKTINGLLQLTSREFKTAAHQFINAPGKKVFEYPEIFTSMDVGIYGGFLSLATFNRRELKRNILDNEYFKNYLELVPEMRDIIYNYYESKYADFVEGLEKIKPQLLLDQYLSSHVERLYTRIREKAIIQYFSPYLTLDMKKMAKDFGTTLELIEIEVSNLIAEDKLAGKIDQKNKILYGTRINKRSQTFQEVLSFGKDYRRKTRALLLRANLIQNKMTVKRPRKKVMMGGENMNFMNLQLLNLMRGFN